MTQTQKTPVSFSDHESNVLATQAIRLAQSFIHCIDYGDSHDDLLAGILKFVFNIMTDRAGITKEDKAKASVVIKLIRVTLASVGVKENEEATSARLAYASLNSDTMRETFGNRMDEILKGYNNEK